MSVKSFPNSCNLIFFPSRRKNGFTLIEIAVVILIIGMLAVVVFPRLPSSDSAQLVSSARMLSNTIRHAQEKSVSARKRLLMEIQPGTSQVRFLELSPSGQETSVDDPFFQQHSVSDGITVEDVSIPRLGKLNDGTVKIPFGVSGIRELLIIHLKNRSGESHTVIAYPSGGKVKSYEGYLESPP